MVSGLERVGRAWIRGRLYDLGDYPGAVADSAATTRVHGQVFRLPADPAVLRALDAYEGYNPAHPAGSLFVRTQRLATLGSGRRIRCWIYVYGPDPGSAPVVPHGNSRKLRPARLRKMNSP